MPLRITMAENEETSFTEPVVDETVQDEEASPAPSSAPSLDASTPMPTETVYTLDEAIASVTDEAIASAPVEPPDSSSSLYDSDMPTDEISLLQDIDRNLYALNDYIQGGMCVLIVGVIFLMLTIFCLKWIA